MSIFLLAAASAQAKPKFSASEVTDAASELMICDLDGDGLKDLVLLDGLKLSIFYQAAGRGFTREPQQTYALEPRPCLLWTARLGGSTGSLLVLTSDGVTELSFTNRAGPAANRPIIRQLTAVPEVAERTNVVVFPLSVETRGAWPLLLVPVADGLQVWQHRDEWRLAQFIRQSLDSHLWPSLANPGYSRSLEFNLSVGDVNGDAREDLVVKRTQTLRTNLYTVYLQQTNGLFALEPALTYADKVEPFSWLCWADLNRDGNVDLIKSVWLNEPSFVPGVPAGKVLVSVYTADQRGVLPAQPQQLLRKNDWLAALPVMDIDGDRFPDLALGYGHIDSREGVRKQVTAKQLDYTLRFFFYRPGAGYPKEADFQRDVLIHLDHIGSPMDWDLPQNFHRSVKVGGDFNGDGKTDLLVRDQSGAISVYFFVSRKKGFSLMPDLLFNCLEPIAEWQVADLNGDGVSDLIVKLAKQDAYRIFLSRR